MEFNKTYTPSQAMLKAASYCAYQERCYKEVEEKLAEWGVYGTDAGEIMIKLSEQNYLNEERYAKAFVRGKFRIKKWGKVKIKLELKHKKISDYYIKIGLTEIEEDVYSETLVELARKKFDSVKEKNILAKRNKTALYLISRGFETDLVWNQSKQLT